jgi:hypothetical protein
MSPECEPARAFSQAWDQTALATPFMRDPVWVYDNWSAYAEGVPELRDTRLTETLAMQQLDQLVRVKRRGVRFDYYMMNAFWFAPDGAYRRWRKPDWPDGPDRWIEACDKNGLKCGMWFGTNSLWKIDVAPAWRSSLAQKAHSEWQFDTLSMFEGGFLSDFMDVLQFWYERGIRMFELDAAQFDAATERTRNTLSREEIRWCNQSALAQALKAFRASHPDAMLVAFNDFGGDLRSTQSPFPFKKTVDLRWLEVFDSLYSGDTRASDLPMANFWRSIDLYNDHMVRRYEQSGVPLERIDPFFTLSTTWFGYSRGKRAWKGMLLLTLARGSWKKSIYGSLGLLSEDEVKWFAKAQRMYEPLIAMGRTKTFGGIPGEAQPYGFGSFDIGGALYTVVNPSQEVRSMKLPLLSAAQPALRQGRVLFRDAGFAPVLSGSQITLGPEQMAMIGFGRYFAASYDLGIQDDVIIPNKIQPVATSVRASGSDVLEVTVSPPVRGDLRVLFQQHDTTGAVVKGNKIRGRIEASQGDKKITIAAVVPADPEGFGGVSWNACEIRRMHFSETEPITLRYSLHADRPAELTCKAYAVEY